MRITRIEVAMNTPGDAQLRIAVQVDSGIVGEGEIPDAAQRALESLAPLFTGSDPFGRSAIRNVIAEARSGISSETLACIQHALEMACLDLAGKHLQVPANQFFGGPVRNEIRACATGWHDPQDSPRRCAEKASRAVGVGFTALELDPFGTEFTVTADWIAALEKVQCVREAIGPEIDLVVDAKERCTASEAIKLAAELEPFEIVYLQDPVRCDDLDALRALRHGTAIPIGVGHCSGEGDSLRRIVEDQLADFLHLECRRLGGASRVREFALLAETWFSGVTLHHEGGFAALALNAQIATATPNVLMTDVPFPFPVVWGETLGTAHGLANGCFRISRSAGLGLDCQTVTTTSIPRTAD